MSRRLLLFDIDGTLIKSRGLGRRALDRAFHDLCGWEDATRDVSFLGATDPGIVRSVFGAHGRGEAEAASAAAELLRRYEAHLRADAAEAGAGTVEVLPGVRELVARLAATEEVLLGLLTGNTRAGAEVKLGLCDLWDPFPLGAFGDDADRRSDLLPVALERAAALGWDGLEPRQCVVVGDTPRDVEVARAHGARAVAVATGWLSAEELAGSGADLVLPDLGGSSVDGVVEGLLAAG